MQKSDHNETRGGGAGEGLNRFIWYKNAAVCGGRAVRPILFLWHGARPESVNGGCGAHSPPCGAWNWVVMVGEEPCVPLTELPQLAGPMLPLRDERTGGLQSRFCPLWGSL